MGLHTMVDGIVGTRPNMMKMAAVAKAMAQDRTFRLRLVHTGQHYDESMSEVFFRQLGLPEPSCNLGVGAGTHAVQTARILEGYESLLLSGERPAGVVVVGDVTSTMACALAAVKIGVPVAHVEAGLRSGDRGMPEEINRIVTDAVSDILFVSDPDGLANLAREGHPADRVHFVGNVMIDTLFSELEHASADGVLGELGLQPGHYAFLTLHRPANVDFPTTLSELVSMFYRMADDLPIVFSVHPRTKERLEQFGIDLKRTPRLRAVGPLGYHESIAMLRSARVVLSDSGGIQEEASVLDVPCITLRDTTERPCTVTFGSSELVGNDVPRAEDAWRRALAGHWKHASGIPLWDGHAAERVVSHLKRVWASP